MKILISKHVFQNFKKKLKEAARGDSIYNNTHGFYGNHGSVKSFNADEEDNALPLSASPHMATQLTIEEPPVADPDYVPGTHKELGLALSRIAKEVPASKIEYFYRKSHYLLDDALDSMDESLFESIDYEKIHPMHQKAIKDLINQYLAM